MASLCSKLFEKITDIQDHVWPIVYSKDYNITFLGMEKLHPFDSSKWGNVFKYLQDDGMVTPTTVVTPKEISRDQLLEFHTVDYINSLRWSANVARITEVAPVACLPNFLVQRQLLSKLRLQTSGTIIAARLALARRWAINLGGGFHHCSSNRGGGFCAYADISGALKTLKSEGLIDKALIIDLDAHQGNGHQRDFMDTEWVRTLDVYNGRIYPYDCEAKKMKNLMAVEIEPYTEDAEYLETVKRNLEKIFCTFGDSKPDVIAYNAGTDCMVNDPLGLLRVSDKGIIERDELVFQKARELNVPIFMVLSGGYQRQTALVIANSILNLRQKGLINIVKTDGAAFPGAPPLLVKQHEKHTKKQKDHFAP